MAVGDVNGDGIPDLIIGAYTAAPGGITNAGSVFVVFGTKNGFPDPLPLSSLNGSNGFRIDGVTTGLNAGLSVAAGDINHDGYADIIIGAPDYIPGGGSPGYVYVVYGAVTWSRASYTLDNNGTTGLINGTLGFRLDGASGSDLTGSGGYRRYQQRHLFRHHHRGLPCRGSLCRIRCGKFRDTRHDTNEERRFTLVAY